MIRIFLQRSLAVAALAAASSGASAALTAYSTQAGFLASIASPGVDTYTGLSLTAATASPATRSAGSYSYTVSATNGLYGSGTTADPWLSTNRATDSLTFSSFTSGVIGIGGYFFDTNISGAFAAGDITLTATDSLGTTLTQTLISPTTASFLGFTSNGTITSLVATAVQPANVNISRWPSVNDLTLGVSAVPEPATCVLMLAGLGLVGAAGTRRRRR